MLFSVVRTTFAACLLLIAMSLAADAADVTLRMRGGSFEVTGQLRSFDLRKWVIVSPGLGTLTLDANRYECIGDGCPQRPVAAAAPFSAPATPVTTTWYGGSGIGTEFMPRLIRAFAASIGAEVQTEVGTDPKNLEFAINGSDGRLIGRVKVNRQGVPQGFAAIAKGAAEVVWSSSPIGADEQQIMAAVGVPDMTTPENQHVWGLDAMVVLVAKQNPVVSLPVDTIAKIFSGEIRDWSELGLQAGRINVYAPTADMGLWSYFYRFVMEPRGLKIRDDATRLLHATEWSDKVASDPNGIGINFISYVRRAKAVNIELPCGIVVPPSVFSAKNEEYPLTRRLFFYTRGKPANPLAAALLSFALSPRVQPVLKEAQFVDQEPELSPFSQHTGRIAVALNASDEDFDSAAMTKLIQDIRPAQRLSLTYRFAIGGFALDSRGSEDVARLQAVLRAPEMKGKTVLLIGFSDSIGSFKANLALAKRRAQVVRTALARPGSSPPPAGVEVVDTAYGELAPVACNETPEGRTLNRRVEVWIR